jgi:DNA polymerase III subunit beta
VTSGIEEVLGADDRALDDPFGSGSLAAAQYEPFSFTVKRLILAALVDKAISVVPNRDVMPVLRHFLVQLAPGRLQLAATDLELSVLAATPAVTTDATQTLVLPARKLLAILREVPDGDVIIDVAGEFATVRAGTASWSLLLADAGEYPQLPDPAEVEMHPVNREAFAGALRTVRHAVGRDAGRPALMQVDIDAAGDGPAKVTACDSVRFARTALPGFPLAMQIPSGALDGLVKMLEGSELDEVQTGETDRHLVFRISGTVFLASKMLAKFPDVEKLLLRPALENRNLLTADRDELAAAVRRARINADPETSAIGLQLRHAGEGVPHGTVTVIARDKYGNRAEETVSAGWEHPERLVVVNHQFLTDMLAAHPSAECRFLLGPESGKKRSVLMLRDDESGTTGIIYQMLASLVGYGE